MFFSWKILKYLYKTEVCPLNTDNFYEAMGGENTLKLDPRNILHLEKIDPKIVHLENSFKIYI